MVLGKKNKFSTEYFLLPTHIFIIAHESHEFTRIFFNELNGDLFGRTNHTNIMIEFVKIRATDKVAIIETQCYSCKFVRFVGKNIKLVGKKNLFVGSPHLYGGFPFRLHYI